MREAAASHPGPPGPQVDVRQGHGGALPGDGHAVSGERRNQPGGIPEWHRTAAPARCTVIQTGHGTKRVFVRFGLLQPPGQLDESGLTALFRQGPPALAREQAAHVHCAVLHRGKSDISVAAQVQFEVVGQRQSAKVLFEAHPGRTGRGASTASQHASGPRGCVGAVSGDEFAAEPGELGGQGGVEPVTAEAEGGIGKLQPERGPAGLVPDNATGRACAAQRAGEVQGLLGILVQRGDEFAADPVTRIVAGLADGHGQAPVPQGDAERQTGESAADDFDRPRRFHPERRRPPDCANNAMGSKQCCDRSQKNRAVSVLPSGSRRRMPIFSISRGRGFITPGLSRTR